MKGDPVRFEELNEKPVFLNIWATWCPPCIAELPGIEDLHENYGNDVSFVLVSNEDPNIVLPFAEKHGYGSLPFYYARRDGTVVLKKKGAARWNSDRTKKLLDDLVKR